MKDTLFDKLKDYSLSGALPMHMPGHKRNTADGALRSLGAGYDITEIHGFDNLHCPESVLRESMEYAAGLWGSRRSYYLVGGSTAGILAAIYAAAERGGRVIMARNCHKSVYNALELCSLSPVYVMPELCREEGFYGSVSPEAVKRALEKNSDASLVIITSPTYEGVVSDVEGIARVCREKGMPLLCDEAHGAHLSLFGVFAGGAVQAGADIVVQSLHKTLSSLTQTAVLHVNGDKINCEKLSRALSMLQTSSPSYLLLASIDSCVRSLDREALQSWKNRLDYLYSGLSALEKLSLVNPAGGACEGMFMKEPSKVVIAASGTDITGYELAALLREKYSVELEMSCDGYAVAMTGQGDTQQGITRFVRALLELDSQLRRGDRLPLVPPGVPEGVCGIYAALQAPSVETPAETAEGKISGEYVYAYPPGIPLIVPGERISREVIEYLSELSRRGGRLHSSSGMAPHKFRTIFCT